jgi:energy-coupling factor transporter ATP-binding protein EcfA2
MAKNAAPDENFHEAESQFDLSRLKGDLELQKQGEIPEAPWRYFKGILCGYEPKEIEAKCYLGKKTVSVALTRDIKGYLLPILQRPEDKRISSWSAVRQWVIDAGYGIGENYRVSWQQVCRSMLDRQKKLSTNEAIASEAMQFDLLNDEIFVSLALVERKDSDRLNQDIERYEEQPPIRYEVFGEQVLEKGESDRIAIIGEPGAGKTTLLQHIAFWILDQGLGLPIWISLGDLVKSGELQRLKVYLTQVWLEDAISNVTQDVKADFLEQLNEQRVWLLLDGADEIFASSSITLDEINQQLRGWLSQTCILLTCRRNVWDADVNALRDFQTYWTKEFHYPTQVEQFIENGFRRSNPSSGQRLKTELAKPKQERLQQLVRNPLRLMMLCTTWQEPKGLPSTKAELYERFVGEFYKWNKTKWKKKDLNYALFPNTEAKQEKLNQALGHLACRALDEEASPFRLPHNLIVEELGDSNEDGSNFWLALNLGWLQLARNSDKLSEKVYTFFHPTFQEYFAALAIEDWDDFLPRNHVDKPIENHKGECRYRIFESQWKEVILLWLGQENSPEETKESFSNALKTFEDGCGSFYSLQTRSLLASTIVEWKNKASEDILEHLLILGFGELNSWGFPLSSPKSREARKALKKSNQEIVNRIISRVTSVSDDRSTLLKSAKILLEIDFKVHEPTILEILQPLSADEDQFIRGSTNLLMYELDKLKNQSKLKDSQNSENIKIPNKVKFVELEKEQVFQNVEKSVRDFFSSNIKFSEPNQLVPSLCLVLERYGKDSISRYFLIQVLKKVFNGNFYIIQALVGIIHLGKTNISEAAAFSLIEILNRDFYEFVIVNLKSSIEEEENENLAFTGHFEKFVKKRLELRLL